MPSHHHQHLRYAARERDLMRLRNEETLIERLARSLRRR
jgi:hypothetical protein